MSEGGSHMGMPNGYATEERRTYTMLTRIPELRHAVCWLGKD